jgi:hypothetical protein
MSMACNHYRAVMLDEAEESFKGSSAQFIGLLALILPIYSESQGFFIVEHYFFYLIIDQAKIFI